MSHILRRIMHSFLNRDMFLLLIFHQIAFEFKTDIPLICEQNISFLFYTFDGPRESYYFFSPSLKRSRIAEKMNNELFTNINDARFEITELIGLGANIMTQLSIHQILNKRLTTRKLTMLIKIMTILPL